MNRNLLLTAVASLLAGVVIGWTVKPASPEHGAAKVQDSESKKKTHVSNSPARIKTVAAVVKNTAPDDVTDVTRTENIRHHRDSGNFMNDFERMKTEAPERYAAITNRMAQFRNRMAQRTENKLNTLASIDTHGWSRSQIETHEKYQDLIAKHSELMEIVRHDSEATEEERSNALDELRRLGRELHETGAKERNILLDKAFQELGYSGADAKEIRETVKTIYSTTEEWGGHHRHGGRRGPGRR